MLSECKAFDGKPLKEKWIKKGGLCFHCLPGKHRGKECEADVKCSECGSNYHLALLHLEKEKTESTDHGEEIRSTCTAVCRDREGGLFPKQQPEQLCRVYAIVDDQSNAFMISPDLVDKLGVTGPK